MSTRATIHFMESSSLESIIYIHSDGYPGMDPETPDRPLTHGVLKDLHTFFQTLKEHVQDSRLNDSSMLAARFVVWQAMELAPYASGEPHPLNFLGVRVLMEDPGDIEYVYEVDCSNFDDNGFPVVRWRETRGDQWYTVNFMNKKLKHSA